MTTFPPSPLYPYNVTPLPTEQEARGEARAPVEPVRISWRRVMVLMLLALATAHIPQPAAAQTCIAPPTCSAGQALTWNGTAWGCVSVGGGAPVNGVCGPVFILSCSSGVPQYVSGPCPEWGVSWQCVGLNGGTTANCYIFQFCWD